jgi:hypothetical protein
MDKYVSLSSAEAISLLQRSDKFCFAKGDQLPDGKVSSLLAQKLSVASGSDCCLRQMNSLLRRGEQFAFDKSNQLLDGKVISSLRGGDLLRSCGY